MIGARLLYLSWCFLPRLLQCTMPSFKLGHRYVDLVSAAHVRLQLAKKRGAL